MPHSITRRRLLITTSAGALAAMLHRPSAAAADPTTRGADAFVRVSPRDPRYFELTDGRPYIPIGFNLVPAPQRDMDRVLQKMAENRVNYCRIWIDQPPFGIEHARAGEYDAQRTQQLKQFLSQCRSAGIRVKMCIEFFRDIPAQRRSWSDKPLYHKANGGPFESMNDYLTSDRGHALIKKKLAWYAQQIGDEPAVFAWELWNEMNAIRGGQWQDWTKLMLPELHRLFPKNLAVQSLGSFDTARARQPYRQLVLLKDNDVAQVHRYLDQGAELKVCHGPVDLLANDAVGELLAFNPGKPIILTETGAVKPRHSGVSELYAKDRDGILLHDMLFAPFFSGAAGTGHVWWWPQAIDQPNHWAHFARFAAAIDGIDPPAEAFTPVRIEHPQLRIYALKGRRMFVAWCRDSQNDWSSEIAEGKAPVEIKDATIDGSICGFDPRAIRFYDPWTDHWSEGKPAAKIALPPFRRSMVIRIQR